MDNNNSLKVFAFNHIFNSNNTKQEKLEFMNFIKESSSSQIKYLLLCGHMVSVDKVPENIHDSFENIVTESKLKSVTSLLSFVPGNVITQLTGIPFVGPIVWTSYRALRSRYDSCTKKCGTYEYNTIRRQYCVALCKINAYPKLIASMKSAQSKCKSLDEKKQTKCIQKLNDSIGKINIKLVKAKRDAVIIKANFKKRGAELPSESIENIDVLVDEVLKEAGGRVAKIRKTFNSQAAAVGVTTPLWAWYRKIREKHDICTKRCGTYEVNTSRRQHCMIKCKVDKVTSQLAAAKKAKNEKEIEKLKVSLVKAKESYRKSVQTFKKRNVKI